MDRDTWIEACTRAFERRYDPFDALSLAMTEFNIRCRDEPLDSAPELPVDRWPDPSQAAEDALREYDAQRED